ncbi:MAG: hypothetical protein ACRD23_06210 [Terriglobales bacterium]
MKTRASRNVPGPVPRRLASVRCVARSKSGERCHCFPVHGKKRCLLHLGENAKTLGAKGGRRRAIFNPANLETFPEPTSANEMLQAVAKVFCQVYRGQLDPRVSNAAIYASAAFFKGSEMLALAEIRKEIDALKANWKASQQR